MALSPFDFLTSINDTKQYLFDEETAEKDYNSFMVNRGLSYFPDTALLANEMNRLYHIDSKLQYDFYINSIRKRKRFSKWYKKSSDEDINAVKEYYNLSDEKAQQVISLLTDDQLSELKQRIKKGGTK